MLNFKSPEGRLDSDQVFLSPSDPVDPPTLPSNLIHLVKFGVQAHPVLIGLLLPSGHVEAFLIVPGVEIQKGSLFEVVSEQFQNTTVFLKNGDDHTGRLMAETGDQLVLVPNQLQPDTKVSVKKTDVARRSFSKISPMPANLADGLTKDDLLDMLAFIESYGRKSGPAFAK